MPVKRLLSIGGGGIGGVYDYQRYTRSFTMPRAVCSEVRKAFSI
jgi:hypothetical protein